MKVKPPPLAVQRPLLDVEPDLMITSVGQSRAAHGRVVERLFCEATPAVPVGGGGSYDVVYDAWWDGYYVEVKSVKAGSSIPIYNWRIRKDMKAVGQGHKVVYAVVTHRCHGAGSISEVWDQMCETVESVYLVPAQSLLPLLEGRKTRKVVSEKKGSRIGYERKGYCDGYKLLPVSAIRSLPFLKSATKCEGEVRGRKISFSLHRHDSLSRKLIP